MAAGQTEAGKKAGIGVSIFSLALNLAMLIVGAQYNSVDHCKLEVSKYIYIIQGILSQTVISNLALLRI